MNPGQVVGIDKLPTNVPLAPTTPTTPVPVSAQTIPALAAEKPAPATPSKRKKKRKLSGSSSTGVVDQLNVSDNVPQTPTPTKANPRSKKATAEAKAAAALAAKQQQQLQQQMYMSMPMGGDVMVVGEPGLMGGDFGEEDERLITRLENNQIEINSSHALHHQQQQQHMQYQQHHFNNPSRSSPIQLVNADMHSHPTRPHSLQSHLSQPNVSPSLMSLPPRPQSTSSHLLASSSVHEPTTHLQSPSTNQIDTNNSNTIMSSLINEANEIADGGSSSGTNVFNPITSASNLASSSDGMDFNEPNIGPILTAAAPAVNQPSTSSSSIASSSAMSPNQSSPSNNNNNNNNTTSSSNKSDVQQGQSISLSNYS